MDDKHHQGQEPWTAASSSTTSVRSIPLAIADVEKAESIKDPVQLGQQAVDPNLVDWDGPDDPERPLNWPKRKKWANVFMISGSYSLRNKWWCAYV
jgi:hypothetical protein